METEFTNEVPDLRRIASTDTEAIETAVADGYRYIGTIHEYELSISNIKIEIYYALSFDLEACIEIGLQELRHSRFYADPSIPFETAQAIYRERIERAFKRATVVGLPRSLNHKVYRQRMTQDSLKSPVIVAMHKDEIIGFCALTGNTIDLIAVKKEYQNQGVGRALVEESTDICRNNGYTTLRTATQGSNRQARSFYERCGFEKSEIKKDFHKSATPP